jgi:hypothetical protein
VFFFLGGGGIGAVHKHNIGTEILYFNITIHHQKTNEQAAVGI